MTHTTNLWKRITGFLLALVMVLGMLPAGGMHIHAHAAEAVTMTGGETLYLKPNSNWVMDNARFAAYFFGEGYTWADLEPVPDNEGYYQVAVPAGSWTNVIFCRMNSTTATNDWTYKWNQTDDLSYDGVNNLFTVPDGSWDGATTGWSQWTPTVSEPEEAAAEITGLSITIDGVVYDSTNTSATNPAVITPDSTVTVTAHGTNLFADNVTQDHYVKFCYVSGDFLNSGWWAFSDDGSTASSAAEINDFSSTVSAYELKYGNQGGAAEKLVGSGVYIVYDDGSSGSETLTYYFDVTGYAAPVNAYLYGPDNSIISFTHPVTHVEGNIYSIDVTADVVRVMLRDAEDNLVGNMGITLATDGKNLYTCSTDTWSVYGEEPIQPEEPEAETTTYYFDVTGYAAPVNASLHKTDGYPISFNHPVVHVEGNIYSIEVTADVGIVQLCDAENNIIGEMGITLPTDGSNLFTYSTFTWSVYGEEPEVQTITIYFDNTEGWTTVNAYYWGGNTGMTTWPGDAMTHLADNIWFIQIPADAVYIIFNNGSSQTADITIPTDGKNLYTYSTDLWSVYGEEPTDPEEPIEPEEPVVSELVIGDNAIEQDITYTYTAEQDGTLYITVTELYYGVAGTVQELQLNHWVSVSINGEAITAFSNSLEVATGDTVTIVLESLDGDTYHGTINLSWTNDMPVSELVIGDNAIEQYVTYTYTAEQDGTLYITVTELYYGVADTVPETQLNNWVSVSINGEAITAFSNSLEVSAGDTVTILMESLDGDTYHGTVNLSWTGPTDPEEPEVETVTYYFDVTGYAAPVVAYTYNADGTNISFNHPVAHVEGNIYSIDVTSDVGIVQLYDAEDNLIGNTGMDLPTDGKNLYTYSTGLWSVYGEEPEAETITVYFENTEGWTTVNAYYWSDSDSVMTTWPGDAMTHLADNIWFIQIPADAVYIIFNNGAGTQTADLTIPTDGSNCYTYGTDTWSAYVEESCEITINMSDSYGDGWNGNAIEIYENEELITTVTFDEGSAGTWTGTYYPTREYEFYWVRDSYPEECSFEIIIDEETVFSATTEDCGAFPDGYRVYPACEHDYGEGVVTAPTCTDQGYTTYTCTLCGLSYEDDYVDSLGGHVHAEDDAGVVTDPTCDEEGYTTYTCTVCNESYNTDYVEPLGHSKGDQEGIVTAPTCDEEGYTTYVCTVCNESYTADYVEPLGHSKGDQEGIVTAPTCTDQGYTTYTCALCGVSYATDYVNPLGHTLGEDGNCSVCGELYTVPVWVEDTQIDAGNLNDILGDGTASFDPATKTLTLNGYQGGRIIAQIPLNILLLGENSIESSEYGLFFDIYDGEISIGGTGSLDIYSAHEGINVCGGNVKLTIGGSVTVNLMAASEGIWLDANTAALVIKDSATVIAGTEATPLEEECIYVYGESSGSVTITGSASFICATNDEEGIYVGSVGTESLTISGSATVYANANEEGLDADTITISGGTVTAIGGVDYEGIYADDLIISGGTVTAMGDGQGIEADNITITGGTVNVTGGGMIATDDGEGELVCGTITLGEGMAITAPEGAVLGELDLTAEGEGPVMTVLNPDGTMADTFTISAANAPIVITQQPEDCEGILGESAVFTVVAEGEGLTYQWYYYDTEAADWLKSYSPGSTTAAVSPVFYGYRDGQQYRCVVSDAEGNSVTSDVVTMTLKSGEVAITTQPADVSDGAINRDYTFTVTATGDNLTYRWEVSTDGGETWNSTWLEGYNTDTLTVKLNRNRDGNLYRCIISNAQNTVTSQSAALVLQGESVEILAQPEDVKILSRETAIFQVEATGTDLTFAWYYSVDNGSTWQTIPNFNSDTLQLEAGTHSQAKYRCKITDGSGKTVWTDVVKLKLQAEILSQPESISCAAGETAAFTVAARGENLKYRWYYSTDGGETWVQTWLEGYNTDTLSFMVNASRAAKIYKCVITDADGDTLETEAVCVTIG